MLLLYLFDNEITNFFIFVKSYICTFIQQGNMLSGIECKQYFASFMSDQMNEFPEKKSQKKSQK